MNTPSSLLANPTLSGVNLQLESLRSGVARAQGAEGETRLRELKKATQEFEAVFIGYMLEGHAVHSRTGRWRGRQRTG